MTKYEQKIDAIGQTVARIDEKLVGLSNRLYDRQGDIPAIVKHLEKINGTNYTQQQGIELNTRDIKELKSWSIKTMLKKKWFWVIIVILVLSALGLSGSINIQELLLNILK